MRAVAWLAALACAWAVSAYAAETVTYTYDAAGRLTNAAYGGGATIAYRYDAAGNLLERVVADAGPVETVATPTFDPDGGTHGGGSVTVTVACATAGATIRYTTDGNDPTEASDAVASGAAVAVPVPGTLKARAWQVGKNPSAIRRADYDAAPAPPAWDDGYQDIGGGWRRLNWFGDYTPMGGEGWIWHNKHGFFFVAADALPDSIWMFAMDMGWLWTANDTYPFLFRNSDGSWLWYNGSTNPRWFANMTLGTWESRP
jgi:YD repeat-containing protein